MHLGWCETLIVQGESLTPNTGLESRNGASKPGFASDNKLFTFSVFSSARKNRSPCIVSAERFELVLFLIIRFE